MSVLSEPRMPEPPRDTQLVIRLSAEEYRQVRLLLGEGTYNRVQPLIQFLDHQPAEQLAKPMHLQEVPAETRFEFRCTYGDYLQTLELIGALPYLRAAPIVHHLASLVEGQLQTASRRARAN